MASCVIFGGAGYIGTYLAKHFLETGRFDRIHIADIRPSSLEGTPGVSVSQTDVREAIPQALGSIKPNWIFNLAAVHREPGHQPHEYYITNASGARNVCEYAENVGCDNIYFTSSISVYGPTQGPTDEHSPLRPATPYGGSKYSAEVIHEGWRAAEPGRRLIISRPGVIYGPGDPGNILRMIKAIQKGYFVFPGSPSIYKSYGYIYGLVKSVDFTLDSGEELVKYNYVEAPSESLGELVEHVQHFLNTRAPVFALPMPLLMPVAHTVQAVLKSKSPIHPVRVKKAAISTHIVPRVLQNMNFEFQFDFRTSLKHWKQISPVDFTR